MPNTINLRLLDNKNIIAERNNIPLAQENSYKIIAGEENATIFKIASKPEIYKNATFTITCTNSQGYNVPIEILYDDTLKEYFYLPKGMAVAGYGYINISCTYNNGTKEENVVWQSLKVKVWNTYESWKDYVPEGGNVDLTDYQKKTDEGLLTTDKTIVGAINEVNEKVGQGGSSIVVDAELSSTSENPVQNKVINEALLKNLLNVKIVDQDLSKADFVPTPNTYYRHTNKYHTLYNYGTILFYNGTDYEIVEVLNGFVSKWESIVGGYGTLLMRGTSGKYSSIGIGSVGVTTVGFVPTYAQRTATDGTKSTVLITGNPVNDVDATPKKYVDNLVASVGGYIHNIEFITQGNGETPTTILQKLTGTSKISTAFTYVENKGICLGAFNTNDHPDIVEFGVQPKIFVPTSAYLNDMTELYLSPQGEVTVEWNADGLGFTLYLSKLNNIDLTNITNFNDYVTEA